MTNKGYVTIEVKPETRKRLKLACVKMERDYDGVISYLIDYKEGDVYEGY